MTEPADDGIRAIQRDNGKWVFQWTSPNGRCEEGATHYKHEKSAIAAGRRWLAKREHGQQERAARAAR